MHTSLRVTLAAACAAGLMAAPLATALDTTIRVEGSSANLVPESAIPIEGTGTATVYDTGFAAVHREAPRPRHRADLRMGDPASDSAGRPARCGLLFP